MADASPRRPRIPLTTTVRRTEQLTPSLVRVVLGGGDLARFEPSPHADSYVKIVFLVPGVDYPRPLDLNAVRDSLPAAAAPRLRTYTVRQFDAESQELTVDVVVHGDEGLAGPWARRAAPGDEVLLMGPGGDYTPDPDADWYLLVGDESALPAIAVVAERLPEGIPAHLFLEVAGPEEEMPLTLPSSAQLTWLHRGSARPGTALLPAVTELAWRTGRVHAFVHGEAGFVRRLRQLLFVEREVPRSQVSISGYWRYGDDDEGWRATKRDWNREIEEAERLAGVA
ncbi:MAG TPA: siderophore-interacting protein [Frankiaceae bacterium]|nr:siderophore-interacting protein [Frankiaceae bacterium]